MSLRTNILGVALSLALATAALARAGESPKSFRPPAVPLVACDPYFSIWSPADKLTDADTVHWTGKPHRLTSMVRIDGKGFRLMGKEPTEVPALPQTDVEVLPTRTIYTFEGEGVRLTLTFMTAALPEDVDVLSRPITYLTWSMVAKDGKEHNASVFFEAAPEIAVNQRAQPVKVERPSIAGFSSLSAGSVEQPILQKKGDDLRIDWGQLYVAVKNMDADKDSYEKKQSAFIIDAEAGQYREAWAKGPISPSQRSQSTFSTNESSSFTPPTFPSGDLPVRLTFNLNMDTIRESPTSRWLMLAYDDEFSIQYMKKNLRPYWRRNGDDAAALLKKSAADYESLKKRCEAFDAELMADLRQAGGEKYARLGALAYRQCFAAGKFVADANGQPLQFCKENHSNGCIGTSTCSIPWRRNFCCSGQRWRSRSWCRS
jgi:hypothetical protein